MQVQNCTALARILLDDPSSNGRWSDAAMIGFYNEAQQNILRDVEFPPSYLTTQTVTNQQEYSTPELVKVYTVYLAGQILVPTTLAAVEGHQTQDYDQGLDSGIPQPATQTPGSGGPAGTQGGYTPAWNVTPPSVYPVANSWGGPSPDAQMWAAGQRPRWYYRGGSLGIIPAPAGVYTLVIYALQVPPDAANLTDASPFPNNFRQAIAWKMCELAKFSDDGDRAAEGRTYAAQKYEFEMRKLRTNRKQYDGDQPRMPKPRTYRRGRQIGNNRQGQGFNEYP